MFTYSLVIDFEYCHTLRVADNITLPPIASGCKCKGSCTDPNVCACAKLNGSDFPYVQRDGGRYAYNVFYNEICYFLLNLVY